MNCQEFWNTMPEAAEPHPHLAECGDCTAACAGSANWPAACAPSPAIWHVCRLRPRVEARLLTAFREQSGSPRRAPVARRWFPAVAWAAALAAMLAIGVLLVRERPAEY